MLMMKIGNNRTSGDRDVAAFLCPMTSGGMDDVDAGYNPAKWTYTVSYQKAGDGIVLKETKSRRSFRSLSGT